MQKYFAIVALILIPLFSSAQQVTKLAPGIWKIVYGEQEKIKPGDFKEASMEAALAELPSGDAMPAVASGIKFSQPTGGVSAELALEEVERIYGFGLQVNTFEQRGLRREVRTNSWIIGNVGFSHAPLPFYISSGGYGVLVNSSRYVNFYVGSQHHIDESVSIKGQITSTGEPGSSPSALYNRINKSSNKLQIQVKGAKGIELLVFAGPTIKNVVERYNLYSGGGALPPLWSLGFKYRAKNTFNAEEVASFSAYFREKHIPCDMFGLEPGWQSAAYSCSYSWNKTKYPNPDSLLTVMHNRNYKLNLWEHAYVHPTSPIFDSIVPLSGDYSVWKGAVPDFTLPETRKLFGGYHNRNFIQKGISAFKLDEADGAYYNEAHAEWSYPDIAKFPSGMDGEQMRQILGHLYQKTILDQYRQENKRTMLEARASYLFAAPYSSALYTDMYDNADFVRMIVNSGFGGFNWSPEIRQTSNDSDLIRRLQTSLMSAHMNVDCWFLKNLPWYQYNRDKNNRDEFLPNKDELEAKAKKLIELRMSLIPYLYGAFADYHFNGTPPFRALVMDYPTDTSVYRIDNQYMMGDGLMCAPFINGSSVRDVYFPLGTWYDFNSNKKYEGGKKYSISMSLDELPMFVKEGTILPLAKPVEFITEQTKFDITCNVYGAANLQSARLFEDDGYNFDFEKQANWVKLSYNGKKGSVERSGNSKVRKYNFVGWKQF